MWSLTNGHKCHFAAVKNLFSDILQDVKHELAQRLRQDSWASTFFWEIDRKEERPQIELPFCSINLLAKDKGEQNFCSCFQVGLICKGRAKKLLALGSNKMLKPSHASKTEIHGNKSEEFFVLGRPASVMLLDVLKT